MSAVIDGENVGSASQDAGFPPAVRAYLNGWRVVLVISVGRRWVRLFDYANLEIHKIAVPEFAHARPVAVRPSKVRAIIKRRVRVIRAARRSNSDPDKRRARFPRQIIDRVLGGAS